MEPFTIFYQLVGCPKVKCQPHRRSSLNHPIIITAFYLIWLEVHWRPRNEIASQSLPERISGIRIGHLPTNSWRAIPLSHSPLSAINYFPKKLHVRYLTGLWIHLWSGTHWRPGYWFLYDRNNSLKGVKIIALFV